MTQPLNVPIEHSFLGNRLELGGSSFKVSPELQELQQRYLLAKGERQNMAVSTSCMAMACPIMPLGFLAVLFLLGKLDGMDKDPMSMEAGRTLKGDMARIAAAEALMRKRRDNGEDPESNAYLKYASREMQLRPLRMAMQPIKGSEKRVLPKQTPLTAGTEFFRTKEKASKERELKRKKILFESLNNVEDAEQKKPPESNKLAEKLEKLDQLLNRICET